MVAFGSLVADWGRNLIEAWELMAGGWLLGEGAAGYHHQIFQSHYQCLWHVRVLRICSALV